MKLGCNISALVVVPVASMAPFLDHGGDSFAIKAAKRTDNALVLLGTIGVVSRRRVDRLRLIEKATLIFRSRLDRHQEKLQAAVANVELKPNFDSAVPLESLGITPREAEVLLWIAQGKSNSDIAIILGCAENTVKVHSARIFEKLGIENRNAAAMRALEVLSRPVSNGENG